MGRLGEIAAVVICLLVFAVIAYNKCVTRKWSKRQSVFAILSGVYIALVLLNTVVLRTPYKGVHLKLLPLWRLTEIGRYELHEVIEEILTNVLLLFPFGFLICAGFPSIKMRSIISIGLGVSIIIESLQYISQRGAFEIDDLIFNVIGIMLGLMLGRLVIHRKEV